MKSSQDFGLHYRAKVNMTCVTLINAGGSGIYRARGCHARIALRALKDDLHAAGRSALHPKHETKSDMRDKAS